MKKTRILATSLVAISMLASGCAANETASKSKDGSVEVTITDDSCKVSTNSVPSGTTTFILKNQGTVRNEFEILAENKLQIIGERENLGPGTTTNYTITLEPGKYFTACKKNMVGALVGTAEFTVTNSGKKVEVSADMKKLQEKAVKNYTAYIKDQTGQLLSATKDFTTAYLAGDIAKAKELYPKARQYYERIEPTAEAFGDLDPALDERESDWQEADDKAKRPWTGWHAIEKDLWRPAGYKGLSKEEATKLANKLNEDTQKLYDEVYKKDFKISLDDISNGAIGLLEEVATSKITGEEETFSHTDLWDFKANVEGAEVAFGNVKAIALKKNPELTKQIQERFADLNDLLAKYQKDGKYISYEELNDVQRKDLAAKVNALRKSLAKLTEAVIK